VYPVRVQIDRPEVMVRSRGQLAIRLVAFLALAVVGLSVGLLFVFAYLALAIYAASRLSAVPETYVKEDTPRVLGLLRWVAGVSAWLALLVEHLPGRADEAVHVAVAPRTGLPRRSILWRILAGLPSALVLMLLSIVGVAVWLWSALSVLVRRRVGNLAYFYLAGLQRWAIRLLAYQAALTDAYPPFSLGEGQAALPAAQGT
jgi:hypothetical protein